MTIGDNRELCISLEDRAGALVLRVVGQVGIPSEADQLEGALARAFLHCPRLMVIDLAQMTAISSHGISALLKWRPQIRERIAPLRLAAPQPHVLDLMQRTGMVELFEVFPTVDAALS
ncbi:MAG TPA: STAS domain-containing protein [Tepidisphaeraceae bacterium]|nr:STAS domain-containing protein [Tepidisphaeraceae bacterium]